MLKHFKDLTGRRFTMLVAERLEGRKGNRLLWLCRCDCGKTVVVKGHDLRREHKKSCGCAKQSLLKEARRRVARENVAKWAEENITADGRINFGEGAICIVDPSDVPLISQYIWNAHKPKNGGKLYARTSTGKKALMHHLIMPPAPGLETDHINGNGLDSRRCNLRFATKSQNMANKGKQASSRNQFKGVIPPKNRNRWWQAMATKDGVKHFAGPFATEIEAARAYDALALQLFGDFARLNFPASGV